MHIAQTIGKQNSDKIALLLIALMHPIDFERAHYRIPIGCNIYILKSIKLLLSKVIAKRSIF